MNKIALNIGNLTITWYAIFILTGIIVAYLLIKKEAKKYNISGEFVSNLVFWCVIFGILGARIYYVLFNLDYYMIDPIEVIKIWNGGLAIHGGIIAGVITLVIYCKKNNVNILKMTDIAVVGVIIAQAIGRWGNFFNAEAHGAVVSKTVLEAQHLPNFIIEGMHIGNQYYLPTFLYESILNIIGFIILLIVRKNKNTKLGITTSLYLIWYGIVRFIIESMRTDSLMLGDIRIAMLISVIMVIIGIVMFIIASIKCKKYNEVGATTNGK